MYSFAKAHVRCKRSTRLAFVERDYLRLGRFQYLGEVIEVVRPATRSDHKHRLVKRNRGHHWPVIVGQNVEEAIPLRLPIENREQGGRVDDDHPGIPRSS